MIIGGRRGVVATRDFRRGAVHSRRRARTVPLSVWRVARNLGVPVAVRADPRERRFREELLLVRRRILRLERLERPERREHPVAQRRAHQVPVAAELSG